MTLQWIEEPGTVGQRVSNFARATPSFATPGGGATRVQTTVVTSPVAPFVPRAVAPIFTRAEPVIPSVTWSFTVNNFSGSGNLELGPGEDPLARACEWVKQNVPPGMSVTIDGWKVKANGYWEKAFTFTTDAAFWAKDCVTWASSNKLAGPPGTLGQTVSDWTNVPRPPYWEYTKLPWPPTGALPTTAPPGWELLASVPQPPGYAGTWPPPWPPEAPPNWPEGWPWPLPDAPAPTPPNSLPTPPAQAQPPLPPVPNASTAKRGSAVGPILIGVGLLALAGVALASSGARRLEENPCCPVCGGGS